MISSGKYKLNSTITYWSILIFPWPQYCYQTRSSIVKRCCIRYFHVYTKEFCCTWHLKWTTCCCVWFFINCFWVIWQQEIISIINRLCLLAEYICILIVCIYCLIVIMPINNSVIVDKYYTNKHFMPSYISFGDSRKEDTFSDYDCFRNVYWTIRVSTHIILHVTIYNI